MSAQPVYAASDATGATIALAKNALRDEVMVRADGDRVWIGFNEDAVVDQGVYLDDGEGIILAGEKATSDLYFVCDTGETCNVAIED